MVFHLLKDGSDTLASPLPIVFNLTIQQNVIPAEWKKAKVTPLHKSGTKDDPRNYCPISVLPAVSKVLERLIHKQLASYFDGHNLLCKSQSRFRRMHSTEMAVTYFAGRLAALTRLDLMGSCKCSVAGVTANQRSLFYCFSGRVSLTATNVNRPTLDH